MSRAREEEAKRDAIARTAKKLVEATANGRAPMTYDQAQRRTVKAVERGDQIRRESGS